MIMLKLILLLISTVLISQSHGQPRKQLGGLPSEFESHRVGPVPTESRSSFFKMHLQQDQFDFGKVKGEMQIPVDRLKGFEMVVGTPFAEHLMFIFSSPKGVIVNLEKHRVETQIPVGDTGNGVPVHYYAVDVPQTGFYTLRVVSKEDIAEDALNEIVLNDVADVFVIVYTGDDIIIEASLLDVVVHSDKQVGLKARLLHRGMSMSESSSVFHITDAHIDITMPSGSEIDVDMNDNGLGADAFAGDDYYSGHLLLEESGLYHFEAYLSGWYRLNSNMVPFTKSIDILIPVSANDVELSGTASFSAKDTQRALINLNMNLNNDRLESELGKFRAYTEVYGVTKDGESKPAAWISSIVNIVDNAVPLELNLKWLTLAGVEGPLTLKNTYLIDLETEMVVTRYDGDIKVSNSDVHAFPVFKRVLAAPVTEITEEMRWGVNPLRAVHLNETSKAPTLVMLHGYCADVNPWEEFSSHLFQDAAYFLKKGANMPTDTFATEVYKFTQQIGTERFSVIGHSQGGMVGLHLLNGYWTGIDQSKNGPKVQSVGTPFQGCSGAGDISNIGKMFGITCGKNSDLTTQGASNWLANIDKDVRKNVNYYRTTYKLGKTFGDYCNRAVNMLLQWPNDGVSEEKYSILAGGQDMGNTEQQCHTTGMKYEAQYKDTNRNIKMNQEAAR